MSELDLTPGRADNYGDEPSPGPNDVDAIAATLRVARLVFDESESKDARRVASRLLLR